jgi:hypothetical protein
VTEFKPTLVVYVDVDDTLVRSAGSKQIPITGVIEQVRKLFESGAVMYCWSSGGAEYSKRIAEELGITHCFRGFLPKPNVLIDDQEVADWRLCLQVHPLSIDGKSADDYWREIKSR